MGDPCIRWGMAVKKLKTQTELEDMSHSELVQYALGTQRWALELRDTVDQSRYYDR